MLDPNFDFIFFCSYQILQKHHMWPLLMPKPKILINTRIFKSLHRYLSIADFLDVNWNLFICNILKQLYSVYFTPIILFQYFCLYNFLHMKTLFIASWLTIKFIKHIYCIRYSFIIFNSTLSKQNIPDKVLVSFL